jgi:hypothetical protein
MIGYLKKSNNNIVAAGIANSGAALNASIGTGS